MTEFSAELIAKAKDLFEHRMTTDMNTWESIGEDGRKHWITLAQNALYGATRANDCAG